MLNKKLMLLAVGVMLLIFGLIGKPYLIVEISPNGIELGHKLK